MTSELLLVSVVVLLLVLVVLLLLCWIIRHSRSRDTTELRVSVGPSALTIRTGQQNLQLLLDQLLDRVILQGEPGPESEDQTGPGTEEDAEAQPGGEQHPGSDPEQGTFSVSGNGSVILQVRNEIIDLDEATSSSTKKISTSSLEDQEDQEDQEQYEDPLEASVTAEQTLHGLNNPALAPPRCCYHSNMTLNTQREKEPLRRRCSTPIPPTHSCQHLSLTRDPRQARSPRPDLEQTCSQRSHPPLGQSASYHPGDKSLHYRAQWSSDSDDDSQSDSDCVYRVVLLGDHGVGKSSLAGIFAGITEKDELPGEDTYERTLTVDGEETTLVVMDTWETDRQDGSSQDDCLRVGSAYVIVYSVTDRSSFESASELRITLRRARQAENLPIILVGNKSDLVRSREVAVEEGRACAVVFDCKFIETSASLQHNVAELFEGVVRQIRLRRDGIKAVERRRSIYKRRESLTQKARRFLDRLVARNNQRVAAKARSKSCHDLAVL
ncbi:uncharacterized protein V6R79_019100 [Siganus canaliculatus]